MMTLQAKQEAVAQVLIEAQKQGIRLFSTPASNEEILEFIQTKWSQIECLVKEKK